ncbi:MerR family transcriptional regulator [Streptomyces sp. NBC_00286]|uniref:MerR family transcriptional regulator n=1 Tax=Streptomyces sp. NBC_00286 TaxID=2975701 RepID=UPI002E29D823|nr:MerR family transcriptional regulator [Streptomyces sp. NBC_00286]
MSRTPGVLEKIQIGEVSERTGLFLRTIRHYEDIGVVGPSERSTGGFRLYAEAKVRRLALVRRMRPLGFCLEDVRALLDVLGRLPDAGGPLPESDKEANSFVRAFPDARLDHLLAAHE